MRLAEWLKYVEEQEQKQTQDDTTSPEKVSSSQEDSADTTPKNGNRAVAAQAPDSAESKRPSVQQVESLEKPAQTSLFESPAEPAITGRPRNLIDDAALEIPDIEDFLPFLKPETKQDEEGSVEAPRNGHAEVKETKSIQHEPPAPEAPATQPLETAEEKEKPVARVYKPVPPLFSLPADAGAPEEPIAQAEPVQEVMEASAPAEVEIAEIVEEAASPAESHAISAGHIEDAPEVSLPTSTDTTVLESLPRHIQALGRLDAGSEIAQNSYKRNFTESRSELIQRLLDPPISLEDAARILNVCPTTVRRYTNKGVLPHYRTVGNQRRFRLSDVISFMESQGQKSGRGRPRKKADETEE